MRILHTIPGRNWGGMEHRVVEQVKWLVAHDHTVQLATPADGDSFRRAQALGLPVVAFDFDRPYRPTTIRAFRALVRGGRFDVVDAHYTRDAKAASLCLDLAAVVRSRHVNQPLKPGWLRRMQWQFGCDHVVTVGQTVAQGLLDIGLVDPHRLTAVGGWADESFFVLDEAAATRARLRTELGLAADGFVVAVVGMLRPDKGQVYFLEALATLAARGCAVGGLIVGGATGESTAYADGLKTLAAEKGLPVVFTGYRDDVSALMQTADAVVIPSLTEAQPRVAVQAFACGRPVVASAVGGVPEIVTEGVTGWLVPPADVPALADAIERLLREPEACATIAAGARRFAEDHMRFDHKMAQTLTVYRTAMARAATRRLPPLRH